MKLLNFQHEKGARLGFQVDQEFIDPLAVLRAEGRNKHAQPS